jgi:hypothetical protein
VLLSKGNQVNIPEPGGGCYGNVNELGDVSESPGKSYLFFLTVYHPGIRLPGERVQWLEKHCYFVVSGALSMTLENPRERFTSSPVVLITAAGLQGE